MDQDYSEVEHWHDVWHVAKGKYHTIIVCNIHWFNEEITKGCLLLCDWGVDQEHYQPRVLVCSLLSRW